MQHLLYRDKTYYFNRRVPNGFRAYDPRNYIRFSLGTDSKNVAAKRAAKENVKLEEYWDALKETGRKHSQDYYEQVVKRASLLGFPYTPVADLAQGSFDEILKRLRFIENHLNPLHSEAVMGAVEQPTIMLDDALDKFWDLNNDIRAAKSPHQYKKWQNPRKRAMQNLIDSIGNKPLHELVRDDLLKFRDWWLIRIKKEELKNASCNKNLKQLKTIIRTVAEHFKIKLDVNHLFARLKLEDDTEARPPFSTDHILNVLFNPNKLQGMSEVNQCILKVFSETGVCVDEQACVLPEDIFLDNEIPHIVIQPRKQNKLKTKFRKRVMPLVGFALEAFQRYPLGFSDYIKNPDSVSSAIGKYLKENNMLPTERHSAYSLRHSFQDRLTASKCIDRIQADLMGHKFSREKYGDGASLQDKFDELKKIQLKCPQ